MTKVAALQMCSSSVLEDNLRQAAQLIAEASGEGAQLIVLPEMFAMISSNPQDFLAIQEIEGSGKIQDFLAEQSSRYGVWIVGGTLPIRTQNNLKVRAACFVFNDEGKSVGRYDKVHLFDAKISTTEWYRESDLFEPGNRLVVLDTPFGKLGLAVCYDIRFPALFTYLMKQGAVMFAIPAAFTVKTGEAHWRLLARCRAVENISYVIGANECGRNTEDRMTYGHSLIVDPWGSVIQELGETNPGIAYGNIDLNYLQTLRSSIPTLEKQPNIAHEAVVA